MSKSRMLVSIDTGLATFGMALLDIDTGKLVQLGHVRTAKSDKKRQVSNSSDIVRRAREVCLGLRAFTASREGDIVAVAHESLSLPRNSRAAALIGISLGIVVDFATSLHVPVLEVYPQDVKLGTAGKKSASKEEVRAALGKMQPNLEVLVADLGIPATQQEHPIDAAAVGQCALTHDLINILKAVR